MPLGRGGVAHSVAMTPGFNFNGLTPGPSAILLRKRSIVIAIALWGSKWLSSTILVRSDNIAVVYAISSGSAKDSLLMHLLRCLHFFLAYYDIRLVGKHIAGMHNTAAKALSRDNLPLFLQYFPQANQVQTPVPPPLKDMLLLQRPDWLSPTWRTMFLSILNRH